MDNFYKRKTTRHKRIFGMSRRDHLNFRHGKSYNESFLYRYGTPNIGVPFHGKILLYYRSASK